VRQYALRPIEVLHAYCICFSGSEYEVFLTLMKGSPLRGSGRVALLAGRVQPPFTVHTTGPSSQGITSIYADVGVTCSSKRTVPTGRVDFLRNPRNQRRVKIAGSHPLSSRFCYARTCRQACSLKSQC
jgi:hypothetical protein